MLIEHQLNHQTGQKYRITSIRKNHTKLPPQKPRHTAQTKTTKHPQKQKTTTQTTNIDQCAKSCIKTTNLQRLHTVDYEPKETENNSPPQLNRPRETHSKSEPIQKQYDWNGIQSDRTLLTTNNIEGAIEKNQEVGLPILSNAYDRPSNMGRRHRYLET